MGMNENLRGGVCVCVRMHTNQNQSSDLGGEQINDDNCPEREKEMKRVNI